ncbi:hypothetical protein GCM10009665_40920 [Kitasatospora nipponensis]|uniref:Orc1-like AAA ATPase domain-containing protein n=1 Tax=Kitasatospora nipponensis TaxID=258049 RepID=A0ABP4H3U9_9ACTN
MPGTEISGTGPGRRTGFAHVGRERELHALTTAVGAAPAVVLVEGEAGIGKSRLLREAAAHLEGSDTVVLRGWCHPLREPLPFGPVIDALREGHARVGPATVLSPATAVLAPYLPELAGLLPAAVAGADQDGDTRHQQLVRAIHDLLRALGPVVLMIEDVHWIDEATRELMLLLARNPPPDLRLVLTYRSQDLPGPRNVLGQAYRRPVGVGGADIALAPLTEAQVRELTASPRGGAGGGGGGGGAGERTGGLPLAAEEDLLVLAAHGVRGRAGLPGVLHSARVPRALREAVHSRVALLDAAGQQVVRAAAVLAVPASEELLAALAGLGEDEAERALTAALDVDVLVENGTARYGFRHVLARRAVYETIPAPRRRRLHARAVDLLAAQTPPALVQIAHHSRQLGDTAAWLPRAQAAAEEAVAVGDDGVAAALLQELLAEPTLPVADRTANALALSSTAITQLDPVACLDQLRRIVADPALPTAVRGEIRLNLSRALTTRAPDRAAGRAEQERAILELGDRPDLAAIAMGSLSMSVLVDGDSPIREVEDLIDRAARTVARTDSALAHATVLASRITVLEGLGDPRGRELIATLPPDGAERAILCQKNRALYNAAYCELLRGHDDHAQHLQRRAEALSLRTGDRRTHQMCGVLQLDLDVVGGRWDGLDERLAALPQDVLTGPAQAEALIQRAVLNTAMGRWAKVREDLAPFDTSDFGLHGWDVAQAPAAVLGRLDLLEGDAARSWRRMGPVVAANLRSGLWVWATGVVPVAVRAALECGLRGEAERLLAAAEHGIEGRDAPAAVAEVLLGRGLLAAAPDPGAALGHLEGARARFEALGRIPHAARGAGGRAAAAGRFPGAGGCGGGRTARGAGGVRPAGCDRGRRAVPSAAARQRPAWPGPARPARGRRRAVPARAGGRGAAGGRRVEPGHRPGPRAVAAHRRAPRGERAAQARRHPPAAPRRPPHRPLTDPASAAARRGESGHVASGRVASGQGRGVGGLLQQLRAVVAHAVDGGGDRAGDEVAAGGGLQQGAQLRGVGVVGVEPGVEVVLTDGQRHPVVHAAGVVAGLGGDDRGGGQPGERVVVGAGGVAPELVQPGHRQQRAAVGRRDEVGLLVGLATLGGRHGDPLVVAVGGQQAAPGREGLAEGGLLVDGLGARVDHPRPGARVLRPGRDQPPPQRPQLAGELPAGAVHAFQDGPHRVGGRGVPAGGEGLGGVPAGHAEQGGQVLGTSRGDVSAAHGVQPATAAADEAARPTHSPRDAVAR